ncbi:hypothetical protein ABPG72_000444 [Tetrahymena utriculariae]
MKAFVLLAIIALTAVRADSSSWISQQAAQAFVTCTTALKTPTCANTSCKDADTTYASCIICPNKTSNYSDYLSCVKGCATTFTSDPSATSDSTVATYANGYTSCVQALNGSLLALSAFFLALFALLF